MSAVSQTLVTESSPEVQVQDQTCSCHFLHSGQVLWLHRHGQSFPVKWISAVYAWSLAVASSTNLHTSCPVWQPALFAFVMARSLKPEVSCHAYFNLSCLCSRLVSHRRHTLAVALHCHAWLSSSAHGGSAFLKCAHLKFYSKWLQANKLLWQTWVIATDIIGTALYTHVCWLACFACSDHMLTWT